jgi:hypothetical protein
MFPFNQDDDLGIYSRRKSIFDSPDYKWTPNLDISGALDNNTTPSAQEEENSPFDINRGFGDIYKSLSQIGTGPVQTRYRQFLEQLPQREQFPPTKTQRLASILTGVSEGLARGGPTGYTAARQVLDEPYRTALENYKVQADKLGEAARVENQSEHNKLMLLWDQWRQQQAAEVEKRRQQESEVHQGLWKAQTRNLLQPKPVGSPHVDTISGRVTVTVRDSSAPGGYRLLDVGQAGGGMADKLDYDIKRAVGIAKGVQPFMLQRYAAQGAEARKNIEARKVTAIALKQWDLEHPDYRRDVDKEGNIVGVNKKDPTDVIYSGFEQLSPKEAIELKAKWAKELKQTPPPPRETVTETQPKGKGVIKTTRTGPVPETIWVKLSDGRELPIPKDKFEEAKKRDPGLQILVGKK